MSPVFIHKQYTRGEGEMTCDDLNQSKRKKLKVFGTASDLDELQKMWSVSYQNCFSVISLLLALGWYLESSQEYFSH